jgi:hypothetical protein
MDLNASINLEVSKIYEFPEIFGASGWGFGGFEEEDN